MSWKRCSWCPCLSFRFTGPLIAKRGILVCNGHAKSHVEPVMLRWFARKNRGKKNRYRFMHLDDLVQWVMRDKLIGEFRMALSELGLEPDV